MLCETASRFTKDFLRNDMYFYAATLYSIWTGKCYQKENGVQNVEEIQKEFIKNNLDGKALLSILAEVLEKKRMDGKATCLLW